MPPGAPPGHGCSDEFGAKRFAALSLADSRRPRAPRHEVVTPVRYAAGMPRLSIALALALACAVPSAGAPRKTRNVILVTLDGLRWQELFGGIDPLLMKEKAAGMDSAGALRERLWREDRTARREALLPYFWKKLAPRGVVFGDPSIGSSVRVTNSYRVSYPGYSEILTGRAQDDAIRGNDKLQNPTPTVLEFVRAKLGLPQSKVALFGSWGMFRSIGEHTPGSIFINAGDEQTALTPRLRELSGMQTQMRTPWDARHDWITFEMGLEYLRRFEPRLLHLAFDESDDWAHEKRYDRLLETIASYGRWLERLFAFLDSAPAYRGSTTVILTCDHGRGSTLEDWHSHGEKVPEAARIWLAAIGPDTAPGGALSATEEILQRDIAPTILELMGVEWRAYEGVLGHPVPRVVRASLP